MSDQLTNLLQRIQHLLHFSPDPIIVTERDGSLRGHLLNRLLDNLPKGLDVALVRCRKAPGIRKMRTDVLTQWFQDPLFNPDDTLVESYLRMRQEPLNRLLVIESTEAISGQLLSEWQTLADEVSEQMQLLLLVPSSAQVPARDWQAVYVGQDSGTEPEAEPAQPRPLWLWPLLAILVVAISAAIIWLTRAPAGSGGDAVRQAVAVKLPVSSAAPATEPDDNHRVKQAMLPPPVKSEPSLATAEQASSADSTKSASGAVASKDGAPSADIAKPPENNSEATAETSTPAAKRQEPITPAAKPALTPAPVSTTPHEEATTNKTEPRGATSSVAASASWPAAIADNHFGIQLIAGLSRSKLEAALKAHPVKGWQLAVTKRHGKAFYLAIWGDFATIAQARAAIKTLPEFYRKGGAWPKSYRKIKAEIAAASR